MDDPARTRQRELRQYLRVLDPQTGVRVTGNALSDIGGDGIAMHHTSGAMVENNTLAGFQRRAPQCSAGMWGWNTQDNTFQHNEMSGGHGTCDAQGMDLDEGNVGTVYQYNYSHDNDGGFVLICNGAGSTTTRNVFRYNISRNDGGRSSTSCAGRSRTRRSTETTSTWASPVRSSTTATAPRARTRTSATTSSTSRTRGQLLGHGPADLHPQHLLRSPSRR
ncbi:right-handed parallel beta-helix repeat-containing protein [Streptomyces sp. M10(2022)]